MFWERYKYLCESNGTKPTPLAKYLGYSSGTVTGWKNGVLPKVEMLIKIAEYFNVSVDYLLGNEKATLTEQPASQKLKNLIDSYADLSEDEIDQVTNFVAFLRTKRNF